MSAPDFIDIERHQRLSGRRWQVWIRRGLIAALTLVPLLALLNAFGQRPLVETADAAPASLEVAAPERLRGGLLFTGRFTITAHRTLHRPTLVLDRGWLEAMQINMISPAPVNESSRGGTAVYRYGTMRSGSSLVVYIGFQVNPTNVGRRSQTVRLEALGMSPLTIARTVTVLP